MVRPKYDPEKVNLRVCTKLLATLLQEVLLRKFSSIMGMIKKNLKFFHYRRRITHSFSGIILNRHRSMIESGEVDKDFSNIHFFLPAITFKSEEINQCLKNVSISAVDITQFQLNSQSGIKSDLSKLNFFGLEKKTMADAVVKCLKHMNDVSNSNIIRNATGQLSRKEVPVDWIVRTKYVFHHRILKSPVNFLFQRSIVNCLVQFDV